MRNSGNDPFGVADGPSSLTPDGIAAVSPLVAEIRDSGVALVEGIFGKNVDVTDISVRAASGSDVETALAGEYFLLETSLQSDAGDIFPCLTFVYRDDFAAAFDIVPPSADEGWSNQVGDLQNSMEFLTESLNSPLSTLVGDVPRFVSPAVRTVALPDDFNSMLIAPDEHFAMVMFQFAVVGAAELSVTTICALEVIQLWEASINNGHAETDARIVENNVRRSDREGLTSNSEPAPQSGMRGYGMISGSPTGLGSGGMREGGGGAARPAQFQQFGTEAGSTVGTNIELIMDVNLRITVELGRTQKSIREILELGPGAVLELDKLAGEPVDILVNDKPIAKGEVVVVDENFGVRVTDIISPQRRIASLK